MIREHNEAHARFLQLARRIAYPDLRIEALHETIGDRDIPQEVHCGHYLRVVCDEGLCNVTGQPMRWNGRRFRLSAHMTDMEFVNTAFLAILTALEHEARERFRVDGIALMDSHRCLERTLDFMGAEGGGHGRES